MNILKYTHNKHIENNSGINHSNNSNSLNNNQSTLPSTYLSNNNS